MTTDDTTSFEDLLQQLPTIAEAVNAFDGEAAQREALLALLGRLGIETSGPQGAAAPSNQRSRKKSPSKKSNASQGGKTPKKRAPSRSGPSLDGNLDLRPKGKMSLIDFVSEKKPKSQNEQCTVAVYYLSETLGLQAITVNHVYTVFKSMKWRLPANLTNRLQQVKAKEGYLDTSDMSAISITTVGENFVEHDLPRSHGS